MACLRRLRPTGAVIRDLSTLCLTRAHRDVRGTETTCVGVPADLPSSSLPDTAAPGQRIIAAESLFQRPRLLSELENVHCVCSVLELGTAELGAMMPCLSLCHPTDVSIQIPFPDRAVVYDVSSASPPASLLLANSGLTGFSLALCFAKTAD